MQIVTVRVGGVSSWRGIGFYWVCLSPLCDTVFWIEKKKIGGIWKGQEERWGGEIEKREEKENGVQSWVLGKEKKDFWELFFLVEIFGYWGFCNFYVVGKKEMYYYF